MLLTAEHLAKDYGGKKLLGDVTLYLNAGDKVGLIGVNGTGKSTLLKVLAGVEAPDSGRVARDPNVQLAYLPQTPAMDDDNTVMEQVFADFPAEFRALNEYEARTILTKLGITEFDRKVGELSGGQRKRVALASVFVHPADILVLDEPTNHLDSDMVAWLEQRLSRFFTYPIPCVIIARGMPCPPALLRHAAEADVPVYATREQTSEWAAKAMLYLSEAFAPRQTRIAQSQSGIPVSLLINGTVRDARGLTSIT